MRTLLSLSLLVCLLAACDVLDPSLIPRDGMVGDETPITGLDAGPPELAETCDAPNPPRIPGRAVSTYIVDTEDLRDDFNNIGCTGTRTFGNEGFFRIDVQPGEHWHFHLRPSGGGRTSNPALYLTQSGCDLRQCGNSSDRCGDNTDEHFTFVPKQAGAWFLGIDDGNAGGGQYDLRAFRTTCGNGEKEHGEACDEGEPSKTCDSACRVVLSGGGPMEVEPNDAVAEANAIRFVPDTAMTIVATVEACPPDDIYVLSIADGQSLVAEMLGGNGAACAVAPPEGIEMNLLNAEGVAVGSASVRDGNMCPVIDETDSFARDLDEGAYYLQIIGPVLEGRFTYRLRVTVQAP